MEGPSRSSSDSQAIDVDSFPSALSGGSTVLIAGSVEPATYAVGLRALCHSGDADDTAFVVTTTESADETVATYDTVCDRSEAPSLGLVDTTSEQRNVTALYEEEPVVFVNGSSDLERIVIGLSDLSGTRSPSHGARHLLVRSLTPVLEAVSVDDVSTVLKRISGLRTDDGLTLIGVDYTAHSKDTIDALAERVDGILWTSMPSESTVQFEYEPTAGRHSRSQFDD
ncbi:DUF7504 family protein [Halomicrobium urmianum]|uniref:DUF7504 family protein n=1 Tax=Halomicrobium urmianum TaxID=1586233 RepID=UPI001CD9C1CB|nr:hypothetical protein [Halomicrobium urmianum]